MIHQYIWWSAIRVALFLFLTFHIIVDSYAVGGRSRQDLGLGSWAADLSQGRPYHQTDLWVDAGATWVGNLSVQALNILAVVLVVSGKFIEVFSKRATRKICCNTKLVKK